MIPHRRIVYQLGEVVPRWLLGRSQLHPTPVIARRHRQYDHRNPSPPSTLGERGKLHVAAGAVSTGVSAHGGLGELQTAIADAAGLVGQPDLLDAVLLGMVSREHVFVSGPPGCGKTQLAEVAAITTGDIRSIHKRSYTLEKDTRYITPCVPCHQPLR